MPGLRILLYPFSILYGLIVLLRNFLFDAGFLKSTSYPHPVICIGNIKAGGVGKSPFTEYLVRLLKPRFKVATLSRGYGRRTKGLLMAAYPASALLVGDEPAQFKNKFPDLPVCVAENRNLGITTLFEQGAGLILMDDAFQYRPVRAGLNLVLMEFDDVFKPHILLPAGNYRENLLGLRRADMLIVTKTRFNPDSQTRAQVRTRLNLKPEQKLFFSSILYGELQPLNRTETEEAEKNKARTHRPETHEPETHVSLDRVKEIFLLTGIANPGPLLDHLKSKGIRLSHFIYPDHHVFSKEEILNLLSAFQASPEENKILLCTEKDAQRLKTSGMELILSKQPFYYIPIFSEILNPGKEEFEACIYEYVKSGL